MKKHCLLLLIFCVYTVIAFGQYKPSFGFSFSADTAGVKVSAVFDPGPAKVAGLLANDIIISLGDKKLQGKTIEEAAKIFSSNVDAYPKFILKRKGKTISLIIEKQVDYLIDKKCLSGNCKDGEGTAWYPHKDKLSVGQWKHGMWVGGTEYYTTTGKADARAVILRVGKMDGGDFTGRKWVGYFGKNYWLEYDNNSLDYPSGEMKAYTAAVDGALAFEGKFYKGIPEGDFIFYQHNEGLKINFYWKDYQVPYGYQVFRLSDGVEIANRVVRTSSEQGLVFTGGFSMGNKDEYTLKDVYSLKDAEEKYATQKRLTDAGPVVTSPVYNPEPTNTGNNGNNNNNNNNTGDGTTLTEIVEKIIKENSGQKLVTKKYFDFVSSPSFGTEWVGVNVFLDEKRFYSVVVIVSGGNRAGIEPTNANPVTQESYNGKIGFYRIINQIWVSGAGGAKLHIVPYLDGKNDQTVTGMVLIFEKVE